MWKPETFEESLINLCDSLFVNDVIIINNDLQNTPEYGILDHRKILMVTPPFNLIVNPSWNLGVRLATVSYTHLTLPTKRIV